MLSKRFKRMKKFLIAFICFAILAACAPAAELPTATQTPVPSPSPVPATHTPMPAALWVSPAVPADLIEVTKSWNIPLTEDPALATQKLDVSNSRAQCGFIPLSRLFLR